MSLSGTFRDGEQIEASGSGTPSEFVIGSGNAIKGEFDKFESREVVAEGLSKVH